MSVRCRPSLERLEARALPSRSFLEAPLVPELDGEAKARLQDVRALGAAQDRRADLFVKAGDSNTALATFLTPVGSAAYDPRDPDVAGEYTALADTVDYFRGAALPNGTNSFSSPQGVTSYAGWTVDQLLQTLGPELDRTRAGTVLIMIGTNDMTLGRVEEFRGKLTQLVNEVLARGVIPVLSTVPYNFVRGGSLVNLAPVYNQVIADVADAAGVPLVNYFNALLPLPGFGVADDGTHPFGHPTRGAGDFTAEGLRYGANVRNLLTLQVLDELREEVLAPTGPLLPAGDDVPLLAVGSAAGENALVRVLDARSGGEVASFRPYPAVMRAGVVVALGDVNGDGTTDVICAPASGPPHVKVFDGATGGEIAGFYAFPAALTNGVSLAAGDVTGDGADDVIVGAGPGGGPVVSVFDGRTRALVRSFLALPAGFTGGVSVAAGDVTGDGTDDIVTGAGPGGGPVVNVFDGVTGAGVASFFALLPTFTGGVSVAAGDLDGDGIADILAGLGPFAAAYKGSDRGGLFAAVVTADPAATTRVAVAGRSAVALARAAAPPLTGALTLGGSAEVAAVSPAVLRAYDAAGGLVRSDVLPGGFLGGVAVG